ncbi:MAG TPA: hypothetical protein PL085_11605 [Agriterribacter sp.]|uniref:hypothetical protein n=1 Tax=Agriterribacter sp. TaxID=2821509 RepID=UPI002D10568D|nr:hypothetical protein [Agriterribacter sp.]HRQ17715.1 hypothetical protein [Agriterribacter sp.]
MLPTTFEGSNFVFTKPADMTDEQCSDLPVYKGHDAAGMPCIISCWKFSKEDLEEVQRTGCIYLAVTGHGTPPVSLFTENPFVQPNVQTA